MHHRGVRAGAGELYPVPEADSSGSLFIENAAGDLARRVFDDKFPCETIDHCFSALSTGPAPYCIRIGPRPMRAIQYLSARS